MENLRKLARELTARKNVLKRREKEILSEISILEDLASSFRACRISMISDEPYGTEDRLELLKEELRDIGNELDSLYDEERELRSDIGDF